MKSARAQSTQHEAAMLLSHALTGVTAVVGDGEVDIAGAPLLVVCKKCGRDTTVMLRDGTVAIHLVYW